MVCETERHVGKNDVYCPLCVLCVCLSVYYALSVLCFVCVPELVEGLVLDEEGEQVQGRTSGHLLGTHLQQHLCTAHRQEHTWIQT